MPPQCMRFQSQRLQESHPTLTDLSNGERQVVRSRNTKNVVTLTCASADTRMDWLSTSTPTDGLRNFKIIGAKLDNPMRILQQLTHD